jgi:glutamyl-tRNA reductase
VNILLLGMNHRTASLDLRERYAVEDVRPLLSKLAAEGDIDEVVLLSTCNRVEVVVTTRRPDAARLRLRSFFARGLAKGSPALGDGALDEALYEYSEASAVRHVFRVASSVDSLVVGEPQILGQVKDAYRAAVECGACGPILSRLYQWAFSAAKRVRNETRIAERPVSVAHVAVDLARQIFESLHDKSALMIGAGEMIELALETLRREGLAAIRVANRTPARAENLASQFGASAHGLGELSELLPRSDVVLTCIAGSAPIMTVESVSRVLRARRGRPIFVIDIGVPRNVAPEVNDLDNVYLYDLDDMTRVADANAEERRREVGHAEAIVLEEQERFGGWLAALSAVPTIRHLRERAEAVRVRELDRMLSRLDLDESQQEGVDALTRAIVNKLLHVPLSRLRKEVDREEALVYLEAARVLFGLDDGDAPDGKADPALSRENGGS